MLTLPESERENFERLVRHQADKLAMKPTEFVRKVWYHEQAARFGEYVALTLAHELLPHAANATPIEQEPSGQVVEFVTEPQP